MTGVQERLMVLMDEINSICQKEKLRYVLVDNTAVRAKKKHMFTNAKYDFKMLMPIEDIGKLQKYVHEHLSDCRAMESWENNSYLYQMIFRYVDKQSLLIDGPSGNYFTKPGIAITIHPVRSEKLDNSVIGAERYLQHINCGAMQWKREWLSFLMMRSYRGRKEKNDVQYCVDNMFCGRMRFLVGGRDRLARWILRRQNWQGPTDVEAYWYMKSDGNFVKLPKDLFTEVEWVEFEGRKVCIPGKAEQYRVEENDAVRTSLTTSIRVISECDLPYEEYLDFIKDKKGVTLQRLMSDYRDYGSWMGRIYLPMEEKVERTFQQVRRSVDRIDVWYSLKNKRGTLKEAYQQKDIETLSKLLKRYLEITDIYLKDKIGFYIDDELFRYATLVWESRGKMKYANRVYKLVPDLYKKESVDEYFAKRHGAEEKIE